jgi:signal-transduction protein with cAMP-binding, CBS, and nucleotidyltransferase domain
MNIGEICRREVATCYGHATAAEMAQLMRDRHVGDLIVVEPRDCKLVPIGIVTDRDLVVQVLAQSADADLVTADDLMNGDLVTVEDTEVVFDAIWHMRSRGIRRLPVVDARKFLVGVLTADDVIGFLSEELSQVARIAPYQVKRESAALAPVAD